MLRKPLWVDCIAAAIAGVLVLALSGWLSRLHALPRDLLLFIGVVNLLYACYSFSLARRATRALWQIKLLVYANAGWALACLGIVMAFRSTISPFGILHLVGEAVFVGGLAAVEWHQRARLSDT